MTKYWILAGVVCWVLCGCGTGGVGTPATQTLPTKQEKPVKVEPQVVDANLRFGLRLLNELDEVRETPNLFFSPLSAGIALSMALNGAGGETYTEIAQTLGYTSLNLGTINTENEALIRLLRSPDPEATVDLANGIWVQNGFTLRSEFTRALQSHYNAVAQTMDFVNNPEGTASQINGWVKEQTRGLIDQLFQAGDFDERTRAVLVNTLYFKGKWQSPFSKDATQEEEFTLEDGDTKSVPMMRQFGKFPYLKGQGFQAVGLPYGKGDLMFYLFVPDTVQGLTDLRKRLTPDNWKRWMQGFQMTDGDVAMPRFKIDTKFLLNKPLAKMGMSSAFDESRANFERMAHSPTERLFIQQVVQRAVVQVDEEGTEAAAATGIQMGITSAPVNTFSVRADRPFLFAIVHQPSGAVLFMGIVREP